MKSIKTKLIIALIILIIGVGILTSVTSALTAFGLGSFHSAVYSGKKYYAISFAHAIQSNNLYCVEKGDSWPRISNNWMFNRYKITITGDKATFYKYNDLHTKTTEIGTYGGTYDETWGVTDNALLAAILHAGQGYGRTQDSYSKGQKALFYYGPTWVKNSGAPIRIQGKDKSYKSSVQYYANLAKENEYSVTFYYLTPMNGARQNIILVTRQDKQPRGLPVTKVWLDGENRYNTRLSEITVKLLANDKDTGKTLTLNEANGWKDRFTDLEEKDANGNVIAYTIEEINAPEGYTTITTGNMTSGFTITNTLKTEVNVTKVWDDKENLDELRTSSISVELYRNGTATGIKKILDENSGWTAKFEDLNKYDTDGNKIEYSVKEDVIQGYADIYDITEDESGNVTIKLTNKHTPNYAGYVEITGKVWKDQPDGKGNNVNGIFGSEDTLLGGIKVRIKDTDGNLINSTYTDGDGKLNRTDYAITASDGSYTIRVNYDNSPNVYKLYEDENTVKAKLEKAYVEFEYDGFKYTTVATATAGENTSRAKENETQRNSFDNTHSTVTMSTTNPDTWTDKNITATTRDVISFTSYEDKANINREEVVKYCNGDGTYIRTNLDGAWKDIITNNHSCTGEAHTMRTFEMNVTTIKNVNLGLFEREKPEIGIFSDLSKVEVTMNNQKYTYLYGVRSDESNDVGLKVKFQNKGTFTYRRPVNPSDIAYLNAEENKDKDLMNVYVTYEIEVANLSTTLQLHVDEIINAYDAQYTIESITKGKNNPQNVEYYESNDYGLSTEFKEITLKGLGITLQGQEQSTDDQVIVIKYKISQEAIKGLLAEEATLKNISGTKTTSIAYGNDTLYAEQGKGGRTNNPYGGYFEQAKDTAPSFVLCKDDSAKTLAGTIWEDTDVRENQERVGNGYYDNTEKPAENVTIELHELVTAEDGSVSTKLAKLYDEQGNVTDAKVKSNSDGYYEFKGVVTGEYFVKFIYGDDTEKLGHAATTMDGGSTKVNARNYKSTIITDSTIKNVLQKDYTTFSEVEKMWHITHNDGYSVAVDNMKERLEVEDLYYSNYGNVLNMTAYTKPFKTQVEFESSGASKVDTEGNIENVTNVLNKLDFGIIERPREDLFVEKTITDIKITLQNGQILTQGNPSKDANIKYVKAMGFNQVIKNGYNARNAINKRLLVEIDADLIQGALLELQYEITVTNNNELDYDYGNIDDEFYKNEFGVTSKFVYDKYITKNPQANYYYYGNNEGLSEMKTTIEYVDYLNNDIVYNDNGKWKSVDINKLREESKELISENAYKSLVDNKYQIFTPASESVTIARGNKTEPLQMSVSKILGSKDDNAYDNYVEIIRIDGKTARTIQEVVEGEQKPKTYTPGNLEPGSLYNEQDDDENDTIIGTPTGTTNYIITYVIAGLVGLIIMVGGIILIKKKVLIK